MSLERTRAEVMRLEELAPGDTKFLPTLRPAIIISDAQDLALLLGRRFNYRVTVVDGKYGILFTRIATGRAGLRNEDTKEN